MWMSSDYYNNTNLTDFVTDSQNYCRNPNNFKYGPWCYTMEAGVAWDVCAIPICAASDEDNEMYVKLPWQ